MEQESKIRLRAFICAIALIPIDQYWVIMMEKVRSGPYPTTFSLLANAIFILAVLTGINALVKKHLKKLIFTQAELLLIYTMVGVSAVFAGHDLMPTLVGVMTYPWKFATPENRWAETFIPSLPTWLSVTNPDAIKGLWEGHTSLYSYGYWKLWLAPVLRWMPFILALAYVMACLNTIFRKQWIHRERLTYPIVQLPLAMTEPGGSIWKNRTFWIGFGITFAIVLNNGLAQYLPNIPVIDVSEKLMDLGAGLTAKPWSALKWTPISMYPFVIGVGYLLPTDIVFSCWFFYWFFKIQAVVGAMFGWDQVREFPYVKNQTYGAVIAIVVTMLWTSKGYLKQIWLKAIGKTSELNDDDEPMSYRAALIGIVAGSAALVYFMHLIGMSIWLGVVVFILYFMLALAISRIRAELGAPIHDFGGCGPDAIITQGAGIAHMDKGDFVGLAYLYWFNRAFRAHPMPMIAEGYKMADSAKASQKKFLWGILIAVAIGALATFWSYLDVGYRLGFEGGVSQGGVYANGAMRNLDTWWQKPQDMLAPNWSANLATFGGFAFCMLMSYARMYILGWPFHPIGFAISGSYQINLVWAPLLIAWIIKTTILKFGGLKLYKAGLPFFFGLIVGEMTMGCIWSIIGIAFNIPYYNFWGA